jgi:hypothetical protein
MAYEYRVVTDYHSNEHDFDLVAGDIVTDSQFPEPDIPANLVGMGVLEAADMESEMARLSDNPAIVEEEPVIEDEE